MATSFLLLCLVTLALSTTGYCYSDVVTYITSTQQQCVEVTDGPTYDCRWAAGLNLNVDEIVLEGLSDKMVQWEMVWIVCDWT